MKITANQAAAGARVTIAYVVQWAVAAGVTTGLIEAVNLAFRRYVQGRMIYQGRHFFWLSPLTDLVIFLVLGVAVAVGAKLLPRLVPPRLVAWIFLMLAALGLRGMAPRIHGVAWLVLSAGVATVLSEFLKVRTDVGQRRLWRLACGGLALTMLLMLAGVLYERVAEHRAIASLPQASAQAPNLLWIVLDTVPTKRMSLHGYAQPTTPRLQQFAPTGVLFQRCIATSPWTLPSHGSMFTGTMPHDQTSDWTVALDDAHATLGQLLQQQGYATAGFVANTYYCSAEFGLGRGFGRYREPRTLLLQAIKSSQLAESIAKRTILPIFRGDIVGEKTAAEINQECLAWLDKQPSTRPFFVFINYIDAHGPYVPPPEFAQRFGSPHPRNPFPTTSLLRRPDGTEQLQELTRAYEACVAYLDDQLGRLLDQLKSRGMLDNTLVVITADHGEQLGENGVLGHGNSLYLPQIHVPLILSFPPRLPAGRQLDTVVSLVDLPATVLDVLALPNAPRLPGSSLVRLIHDPSADQEDRVATAEVSPKPPDRLEPGDELSPIAKGPMRSAVSRQYHYILNGDGREELYRYTDDPEETNNLIDHPDHAAALERLRESSRTGTPARQ